MKKLNINVGDKYNRLTILSELESKKFNSYTVRVVSCICDCGKKVTVNLKDLRNGNTKSCGCYKKENQIEVATKHGKRYTSEYKTWCGIKDRCLREKHIYFKYYGGRGIEICDRWIKSFENFYNDMGPKPSKQHSIDRINPDGNYESSNCRWATLIEQANNKRKKTRENVSIPE